MQDLIDRAAMHEDTDIEALREITVSQSVEGDEPSPRVMADGGRPRSSAWRSPLGGPRSDQHPDRQRDSSGRPADYERDWEAERRDDLGLEPQDGDDGSEQTVLPDGGDSDSHASRIAEQLRMADAEEAEEILDEHDPFVDTEDDDD